MSDQVVQTCAHEPCSRPARITPLHFLFGVVCSTCKKTFCDEHHHDPIAHWCPFSDEEYWHPRDMENYYAEQDVMRSQLDVPALIAQAQTLRPGHICTGPTDEKERKSAFTSTGGSNAHVLLTFDDGVKWVARMRVQRRYTTPPLPRAINLRSEVATLQALAAGGVPVPNAWLAPAPLKDLPHISHCFEEYVPGEDRRGHVKFEMDNPFRPDHLMKRYSEQTVNRFTQSLLRLALRLEKVSFPTAGSLHFDDAGKICVGPLITCQSTGDAGRPYLGPFSNAQEMYLATLDYTISSIEEGRSAWPPDAAVLAYLAYRMARKLVQECEEMRQGPFFACHGEPKGDHLMFDNDLRLTGVVDWEWSYLSTKAEALQPPAYIRDKWFRVLGTNAPSRWEQSLAATYTLAGRKDLSDIVLWHCRKYQRLSDLLTLDILDLQCLNATTRAFRGLTDDMASQQPRTIGEWISETAGLLGEDRVLQRLLERKEQWMSGQPDRDKCIAERRREVDDAASDEEQMSDDDRTGRDFRRAQMMWIW